MNPRDHEPDDPDLDAALARLPRTMTPGDGYAERVLAELRVHGLLMPAPRRAPRVLIAAVWFLAGVGTGAAALGMIRNPPDAPMIAASSSTTTSTPAEPLQWY